MRKLLHSRWLYIIIAILVIVVIVSMMRSVKNSRDNEIITTKIEYGKVEQLVSVSGVAEAEQTAELAFPITGIAEAVFVEVGDTVEVGDILITLEARAYYADRQDALAALTRAAADRDELLSGQTISAQEVTKETLARAQETLATTKLNEAQKIENAYRTLLSSDLSAYSENSGEDATPPVISGTYTCDNEGLYTLEVFSSKSPSNYSYRLSGIETGTYQASVEQAFPMGECGLRALFDEDSTYSYSNWIIEIPNKESASYVVNRNAHALAVTQAQSAIALAEQGVTLAEANSKNQNAPARSEAIARADAAVASAQARLERIDATIADRVLRAPFSGTITEIDILPGETVTTAPVVTLLAESEFEVTARIPEIDIGKLTVDQPVRMVFDAKSDETIFGTVSFISLKSTEIDGVAYYKAIIEFNDSLPTWMRSGLNADIEIIVAENSDSLRIPKRFLTKTDDGYEVMTLRNGQFATTTVGLLLEGNDGYVAITGVDIKAGDVVVAE